MEFLSQKRTEKCCNKDAIKYKVIKYKALGV